MTTNDLSKAKAIYNVSDEERRALEEKYPVKNGPYPVRIPYTDMCKLFPHLVGEPLRDPPIRHVLDPDEIELCRQATGVDFFGMHFGHGHHALIIHPTFNRLTGKYGSQGQAVTRTDACGGGVAIIIAPFFEIKGKVCTVLIKAYRPTLSKLPTAQGSGWNLEIPSCGHSPDRTLEESALYELEKEANCKMISGAKPIRLTNAPFVFVPRTMSETCEVFVVPAEPLPGDPYEPKEGIEKRLIVSVDKYRDMIDAGVYVTDEGAYNTSLSHNIIADRFCTRFGHWPL
ncbi:hypothetical protein HY620_02690 [Candidatus Uhrbacteria bacterium]|nr:hypothetical protein [Candidatus Uhrbacteria bacterium]